MSHFLSNSKFKVSTLLLGWNNLLDTGSLAVVLGMDRGNGNVLETLDMSFNGITDEGGSLIATALLTLFKGIKEEDKHAERDVATIEEFKKKNGLVWEGDVEGDKEEGASGSMIKRLDLSRNRLGEKFAFGLSKLLEMSRNKDEGSCPLLEVIKVGWNMMGQAGTEMVLDAVEKTQMQDQNEELGFDNYFASLQTKDEKKSSLKVIRIENTTLRDIDRDDEGRGGGRQRDAIDYPTIVMNFPGRQKKNTRL